MSNRLADLGTASEASLARRLAAVLYEQLVLAAVVLVTGFVAAPFTVRGPGSVVLPSGPARLFMFLLVFGVLAAYCLHFWTGHRRTLAMKTWHLRLVRRDGTPLDRRRAGVRYLAAWIGPALAVLAYAALRPHAGAANAAWLLLFNFGWALVDPEHLFLHDRIAGTRLVGDTREALLRPSA